MFFLVGTGHRRGVDHRPVELFRPGRKRRADLFRTERNHVIQLHQKARTEIIDGFRPATGNIDPLFLQRIDRQGIRLRGHRARAFHRERGT